MGVQWKYLWPVLVLAAALTLGLGAALRFLRPASLGSGSAWRRARPSGR
ncbi:hypothetical protein M5E87_16040 [Flavonifractor plautii]|nr:hypothetical protein M5E87_16040 [Flavonifractor plautii]